MFELIVLIGLLLMHTKLYTLLIIHTTLANTNVIHTTFTPLHSRLPLYQLLHYFNTRHYIASFIMYPLFVEIIRCHNDMSYYSCFKNYTLRGRGVQPREPKAHFTSNLYFG